MKGLYNLMCGVQPVRVIYGDGQVLYLPPLTTVEEVLRSYPHYFVCQPGWKSYSAGHSNQMLSLDAELQSGCIYFLLPVPRLFPTAPSSLPQCRCYVNNASNAAVDKDLVPRSSESRMIPGSSPLRIYSSPQRIGGLGSPFLSPKYVFLKHFLKNSKSKVLPESNLYSSGRGEAVASAQRPIWRSCPWRPRLGCISEEDDLELALEKLKYHGFMYRREASTERKIATKPPLTLSNLAVKSTKSESTVS